MGTATEKATKLRAFVIESNRIEGIIRGPSMAEFNAHVAFIALQHVTVADLEGFVQEIAGAPLRDCRGMNVQVGSHLPPPGGPEIRVQLEAILSTLEYLPPFETHVQYEALHPFMDGNGRSGRMLWAWQMRDHEHDPFALPFLHRFYYQALAGSKE